MNRTKCVEEHRRRSNGPLTCEDCRAADIAAAEERGRRAGIEEAAKFVEQFYGCMHGECFVEGIRALAPRDSGKGDDGYCGTCNSIRGTHQEWCTSFAAQEARK